MREQSYLDNSETWAAQGSSARPTFPRCGQVTAKAYTDSMINNMRQACVLLADPTLNVFDNLDAYLTCNYDPSKALLLSGQDGKSDARSVTSSRSRTRATVNMPVRPAVIRCGNMGSGRSSSTRWRPGAIQVAGGSSGARMSSHEQCEQGSLLAGLPSWQLQSCPHTHRMPLASMRPCTAPRGGGR